MKRTEVKAVHQEKCRKNANTRILNRKKKIAASPNADVATGNCVSTRGRKKLEDPERVMGNTEKPTQLTDPKKAHLTNNTGEE